MSLTTCLKKMGKSLHAQDKADIYAAARKHRSDGLSAIEAARKAVADQLAKADARVSAEESAQRESNESGPEAPADAGVSRSEPLTRAEIDADVKRVFGTAKPLTRLINSGAVSLITKAQAIQRGLGSAKSLEGVKGLHDGTRGYLITDELQPNEVAGVLTHEIGVHHSMERILGAERFDKLQKAMESFRARGDKDVLAAYAAVPKDTPAHHVNHEAIAYLAEHSANHSITQKLVDATKLFLNRLGVPMSWIKAEPAAVRSIARESLLAESRRGNGSVRYNGRDTLYQKVWHGTPHRDIEKQGFKLNKIGTGEGAQAYGWGMYFASQKDVAESYRRSLAEDNESSPTIGFAFDGERHDKMTAEGHALNLLKNGGKREAMSTAKDMLADAKAGKPYTMERGKGIEHYQRLYDFVQAFDARKTQQIKSIRENGQLYHAEIPEDSDLLDWDKPLSEQPEKVRKALNSLIDALGIRDQRASWEQKLDRDTGQLPRADVGNGSTGKEIYEAIAKKNVKPQPAPGWTSVSADTDAHNWSGHRAASHALHEAGIPGLRYLDGTSRNKGEGSANYVIWDEALLTPEKAQITPYYSKRADDEDQTQSALDSTESAATGGDVQSIPDKGVMTGGALETDGAGDANASNSVLGAHASNDPTKSAAFSRWFGDSKVVDAEGKPLVVYHGTDREFTEFRMGSAPGWGRGIYFTDNRDQAEADYGGGAGGRVVEAYLSIRNPWRGGFPGYEEVEGTRAWQGYTGRFEDSLDAWDEDGRFAGEVLRELGYDGVIAENSNDIRGLEIVAFDPGQIKSATGNNGQFDPGNPDIRFSRRKSDADLMARQQAAESGMQLYQPARTDQTQTTEFKRWFAGSKVVDSEGKPLVVYHGTARDLVGNAFNPDMALSEGGAFYFSHSPLFKNPANNANEYAEGRAGDSPQVMPVYLKMENPLVVGFTEPMPKGDAEIGAWLGRMNAFNRGLDRDKEKFYKRAIREAREGGHDGVIIRNVEDVPNDLGRRFTDEADVYIALEPTQIKSATGNNGQFDPGNPNILKSRRTPSDAQKDAAARRAVAVNTLGGPTTGGAIGWNFDAGEWEGKSGTVRRARAALDDKMIAWRDVQDSIAEHLGNAVPDAQNVYRLENLMHGRVKEGIDALEEKQVIPLVKAMQEAKITPAMLEEYLYALHAKERNAQIAKINPKMPDGGSGMTNAEAEAILAKPLPNGMKEIAKRAKAIIRQTRKRLLDHGIITQDQFDAMESQYQNYVPLRGKTVGENEFDSGGSGAGRGIDGRPSPVKQAFGRGAGNRAENILGEIIGDAQRSIIAAEKARVGRAVMRIVLANPNPKLWTVEPVLTERKLDSTGEVYDAVVNDWSDPSIIAVRHRGKVYKVQINHAPLAKALNLVGVDQIGAVTRAAGALNRYFSAVLTRYNPAFIPVNAARDALFGLTGLAVEHGEVTAMKAALYYPKAIRAAWREARRLPPKSQADTYAREFSEDGGKTGYVSMPSVEELQRKIGSGRFGGYSPQGIGRAAQAVGDLVGAMNDSVENALRLSAYVTLREQGMAREKAASYAKELTVNFNRKGSEGTKLNSWFLFYNASMQGIKRTGALMKSPKTWGYLGALTAAQIAAVMYAMGQEDDDGTPIWDKVPDHVKQRNLVFTWLDDGGEQKILTIPMPYGLNVFPYFAGRVADGMMHAENRPRDRAISIAADTVSTAVQSFSPVPLDDGAMGLLPTALRIPLSIQVNRDDFGRQIRKENPFGKFDVPRASIGKPDTLEMFKVMATGLNRIGGGDERTPPPMSAFDVAPEDIEYVLEKLGGGTGKFIIDMATVGQKATGELPVEARDIPIAKRFFTNVNEPAAQQAMFYERREAIERDADMVRDVYEKDGPEAAIALLRSTPSLSGADFRRYKESDPKKGHRKGGIVVVDGRPQLVVRRPDSVYGRYKAAAEETAEVNESMRNAYADSPMSLRPSGERDKRLKELADKRMAAQRIFNAAWNRDVVGGE